MSIDKQPAYTPGPWRADHSLTASGRDFWSIGPIDGPDIAYLTLCGEEELAANTNLIASAPCLLEALQGVVQHKDILLKIWSKDMSVSRREKMLESHDAHGRIVIDKAKAAISKALGEDK